MRARLWDGGRGATRRAPRQHNARLPPQRPKAQRQRTVVARALALLLAGGLAGPAALLLLLIVVVAPLHGLPHRAHPDEAPDALAVAAWGAGVGGMGRWRRMAA